jgi:hypothetical protein
MVATRFWFQLGSGFDSVSGSDRLGHGFDSFPAKIFIDGHNFSYGKRGAPDVQEKPICQAPTEWNQQHR